MVNGFVGSPFGKGFASRARGTTPFSQAVPAGNPCVDAARPPPEAMREVRAFIGRTEITSAQAFPFMEASFLQTLKRNLLRTITRNPHKINRKSYFFLSFSAKKPHVRLPLPFACRSGTPRRHNLPEAFSAVRRTGTLLPKTGFPLRCGIRFRRHPHRGRRNLFFVQKLDIAGSA